MRVGLASWFFGGMERGVSAAQHSRRGYGWAGSTGLSQSLKNGGGMGSAGPLVTPATRGQSSSRTQPIRPVFHPLTNFAACVDAPLGAREIFKSGAARGRVLTCVRPLLRLGSHA